MPSKPAPTDSACVRIYLKGRNDYAALIEHQTLVPGTRVRVDDKVLKIVADAGPKTDLATRFEFNEQGLRDPASFNAFYVVYKKRDQRLAGIRSGMVLRPSEPESLKKLLDLGYTEAEIAELEKMALPFILDSRLAPLAGEAHSPKAAAKPAGKNAAHAKPVVAAKATSQASASTAAKKQTKAPAAAKPAPKAPAAKTSKPAASAPAPVAKKAAPAKAAPRSKTNWVLEMLEELPEEKQAAAFRAFIGFMRQVTNAVVTSSNERPSSLQLRGGFTNNFEGVVWKRNGDGSYQIDGIRFQLTEISALCDGAEHKFDLKRFTELPPEPAAKG